MNTVRLPRIPPPTLESESLFRLVPKPMDESGAYKTTGQGSSAYSCLISTLADDEAEYNYWNQSFWVDFPDEVVEIPPSSGTASCRFETQENTLPSNTVAIIHTHPYKDGDIVNDSAEAFADRLSK